MAIIIETTDNSIRALANSVNDLRSVALERRMSSRLRGRIRRTFGLTKLRTHWLAEHPVYPASRAEAFDRLKEQAAYSGRISDEEADRLTDTDMVMSAATVDGESR